MKKRILFIQLEDFHTEILGLFTWCFYQAEFFLFYPFKDSIFSFKNHLSRYVKIEEVEEIGLDYDLFIFLTGRDLGRVENGAEIFQKHNKKVIQVIHHLGLDKVYPGIVNISLVNLIQGNNIHPLLPVHNYCKEINSNPRKVLSVVGLSGWNQAMKDIDDLQKLADRLEETEFKIHIYTRKNEVVENIFSQYKNVQFFNNLKTGDMIRQLKQDYFTLALTKKDGPYYNSLLTGTIPLSLNINVPVILSKQLNDIYHLEGVFTYQDSILEIIDNIIGLSPKRYKKALSRFVKHKNKICRMNREYLPSILDF